MRLSLLFVFVLLLNAGLSAQQIPNASFETWSNTFFWEAPDSFFSSSPQSYMQGATPNVSKSAIAHSGSFSAKLSTVISSNGDTVPGMLALGNPMQGGLAGGLPYSSKPDSIAFWAKHSIAAGDTAVVMFAFHRQGVLGGFMLMDLFGSSSGFTEYKGKVQWFMPPTNFPDTMTMIFMTAAFDGPVTASSEIWLDDILLLGQVPQIPNSGMEHWTTVESSEAQPWTSLNAFTAIGATNSLTRSTDSYHGSYAARIETVDVFGDSMGILVLGNLFSDYPSGGMSVSHNPRKLRGYYKYSPVGPDTALAGLFSYHWNDATDSLELVEPVIVKLAPASTYQPFEVMLNYNSWPWVDSLAIAFASGNFEDDGAYTGMGSVLLIDSLSLEYYPAGLSELPIPNLRVYPNPASDYIEMSLPGNQSIQLDLYSLLGQLVHRANSEIQEGIAVRFPVNTVESGDYIFVIRSGQGIASGKIRISR
jgi:hypothetical protein